MTNPQDRAQQILASVGAKPATKAAGGRYQRSLPFRPGIRYWSTTLERSRADKFGVQFLGEGIATAHRLERAFVRRGFVKQSTQPTQITWCRTIEWLPDGGIDAEAVRAARAEVDAVLDEHELPTAPAQPPGIAESAPSKVVSFLEFMRNSPLYGVELDLPVRGGDPPREDPF